MASPPLALTVLAQPLRHCTYLRRKLPTPLLLRFVLADTDPPSPRLAIEVSGRLPRSFYVSTSAVVHAPAEAHAALLRAMSRYARTRVGPSPDALFELDPLTQAHAAMLPRLVHSARSDAVLLPTTTTTTTTTTTAAAAAAAAVDAWDGAILLDRGAGALVPPSTPTIDLSVSGAGSELAAALRNDSGSSGSSGSSDEVGLIALTGSTPSTRRLWNDAFRIAQLTTPR